MADSWAFDAGTDTFTLSLDGSGSGIVSRSRTFTGLDASALYTFYLDVEQSDAVVRAFLEVEGGDTAEAEGTGAQTLTARGDTNASGEITVRFGVQEAGAVGSVTDSDDLDYASIGAAHTAGWAKTDTVTAGGFFSATASTDVSSAQTQGGNSASLLISFEGYTFNFRNIFERRVFTGYTPGEDVLVRVWCWASTIGAGETGLRVNGDTVAGGSPTPYIQPGDTETWKQLFITDQADGSGNVTVDLGVFQIGAGMNAERLVYFSDLEVGDLGSGAATVTFTDLGHCLGSGLGDGGTGLGDGDGDGGPGDDPLPTPPPGGYPPPPTPATRPFGAFNIPAAGLGFWNATIKRVTENNIANLLNDAGSASAYLFLMFGSNLDAWLDGSGTFRYELWKATVDAVRNDTRANAALEAAISSGVAFCHRVVDEPYVSGDRYGGRIPIATVERMCQYSKSLWPTWPTLIHLSPVQHGFWMTRHIDGLDWLQGEYMMIYGDCATYRDQNIARATALGHGIALGPHYRHINRVTGGRYITPAELRHYGGILASTSETVAMMGWKYFAEMYNQTGFLDQLRYVRDLYASFDP